MEEFIRKFTQLDGKMARVILDHCLFDRQVFYCDELQTINDEERIGVVIKERLIYVDKQHIKTMEIHDDKYEISDDRLTISVNVNK
jgi:hypothetical protein